MTVSHVTFTYYSLQHRKPCKGTSLVIPPSQPLFAAPRLPSALQQLTEHVFVPGHDAHVQGRPTDKREGGSAQNRRSSGRPTRTRVLQQGLSVSWQTAVPNHDRASENENEVASTSSSSQWPRGQETTQKEIRKHSAGKRRRSRRIRSCSETAASTRERLFSPCTPHSPADERWPPTFGLYSSSAGHQVGTDGGGFRLPFPSSFSPHGP